MSILTSTYKNIINLPRYAKRIIAIIIDLGLCIVCTWLAFYLRLEEFIKINDVTILSVLISILLAIPIFWLTGLYKTMVRFAGSSIILTVTIAIFAYSLLYFTVIAIYGIQGIPRSIGILQPVLLFLGILSSRIIINNLFIHSLNFRNPIKKKNILIYGAGSAGRQLLTSLENNLEMKVVGFLDDNSQFHKQTILGQTVYDPLKIDVLINKKNIDLVLLALPSITRQRRNHIIDSLNKYKLTVKTLPSVQDIVDGKISVSDIKDLTIEDLLSREQVQPNFELLAKKIKSKVVLVTGAGGSIGSEISRQIIKIQPKKLLLLESNEYALYKISEELKSINKNFEIIPLLVNIQNSSRIEEVFKTFIVDTVYHAAAYKHVPLVEENICESIKNNVFGTLIIAKIAIKYNVVNFVLISSDKAVRPTNVMGATKRLAEICVQSLYDSCNIKSKFAIVRFGNVLESSGSVIPKFKKQISKGGPITLTHTDVSRYFMSITEASQLVIQAGAMAEKCEVFILDMGESIKIKDLINRMIKLSGLSIKDNKNLGGDIEVKITGLRPGEKLYEELSYNQNLVGTIHPLINTAVETSMKIEELQSFLRVVKDAIIDNDYQKLFNNIAKVCHGVSDIKASIDIFIKNNDPEQGKGLLINLTKKHIST